MLEIVDWQIFFVLLAAGFFGLQSVRPLTQSMLESTLTDAGADPATRSRGTNWLVRSGINLAVLALAIFGGLILSAHLKTTGVPLIGSALGGATIPSLWTTIAIPIIGGLVLGVIISPLALYRPKDMRVDFYNIPIWRRLFAGLLHGGIVEELVFRWFLLSFFVLLLSFIPGFTVSPAPNSTFWVANILAALVFGLMHLPGSAATAPLTRLSVLLVIALNIVVGLVYGYFFWKSGLEAAMLAHMSTHVALQPCASLLLRWQRERTAGCAIQ